MNGQVQSLTADMVKHGNGLKEQQTTFQTCFGLHESKLRDRKEQKMTKMLRTWLSDHGLTALDVARRSGIARRDMYRILSGSKAVPYELKYTLQRIYGMTDAEYKETVLNVR